MGEKPKNFQQAIDNLEHATESNGASFGSRLQSELTQLEETLSKLKPHLEELQGKMTDEVKKTKDSVENQVKANPWAALGIVGLVFFLIGFLFGFRGSRGRD